MLRVRSRCFPFSFHPSAPSRCPRSAYNYEHEDGPTSRAWRLHAKPLKDKWAISEKLLLFYVENFSPIYVGGCMPVCVYACVCVCLCVCVRVTVVIVLCQVLLPRPSRIRSRIASHRIMCHTLWPGGHIMRHPICMGCLSICLSLSFALSLESLRPLGHLPHSSALRVAHNT